MTIDRTQEGPFSPEFINVQHSRKTSLVIVNCYQLVLVENEQPKTGLLEHAILFILPCKKKAMNEILITICPLLTFTPLQMVRDHNNPEKVAVLDVK